MLTDCLPNIVSIRVGNQVLVLRVVDDVEPELLLVAPSSPAATATLLLWPAVTSDHLCIRSCQLVGFDPDVSVGHVGLGVLQSLPELPGHGAGSQAVDLQGSDQWCDQWPDKQVKLRGAAVMSGFLVQMCAGQAVDSGFSTWWQGLSRVTLWNLSNFWMVL